MARDRRLCNHKRIILTPAQEGNLECVRSESLEIFTDPSSAFNRGCGEDTEGSDAVDAAANAASNTIEETGVRTRQMEKKLRQVEELPAGESSDILELAPGDVEEEPFE